MVTLLLIFVLGYLLPVIICKLTISYLIKYDNYEPIMFDFWGSIIPAFNIVAAIIMIFVVMQHVVTKPDAKEREEAFLRKFFNVKK
jgi:hypothetical protein